MTRPVSRLDRLLHAALWVMAIVLIPFALLVGIGRELMPLLPAQKPAIERLLKERTGLDLRLGDIRAEWVGFSPRIEVERLTLLSPSGATLLNVPRVTTAPDWLASLRDLAPRLRTQVSGLSLTLAPAQDGGVEVLELASLGAGDPARARQVLRQLIAQPGVVLSDNVLRWQVPGQPIRQLRDVQVQQYKTRSDYRLQIRFRLDDSPSLQTALLTVAGDPLLLDRTPWHAWLQLDDLPAWMPWLDQLPADIPRPTLRTGRLDVWLDSPGGKPAGGTAVVHDLGLVVPWRGHGEYVAEQLAGTLSASRDGAGWHIAGDDLSGNVNGRALPLQRVAVDYAPDRLVIAGARLSLSRLDEWLEAEHLLPMSAERWRRQIQPGGLLPRAWISLRRDGEVWQLAEGSIEFKALGLQPVGEVPGVRGLAGWLQFSPDRGLVYLDTRRAELSLPRVFHEPLAMDVLRGGLRWVHQDGVLHVDSGSIQLTNADADTRTQLALRIPDQHPEDATLELLARLRNGSVANAWRYVPWSTAGDGTVSWLKQALTAGTVTEGAFLHSGRIAPGPRTGRFDMQFQLAGAQLDYVPGWPALRNLDADLRIEGPRLTIAARKADIMGGLAHDIRAEIPDLQRSMLQVDAGLSLDLKDLDTLLAESPLKKTTAEVARALALSGPAVARLGLKVALASGDTDVTVDGHLDHARVGLPDQDLTFEDLTGDLHFSSREGLAAQGLQGQLWGRSARIGLAGDTRGSHWWQQRITIDAPLDIAALGRWTHADLSRYLRGSTPIRVGLTIPVSAPGSTELRINSSLAGMQLMLPPPLSKPAAESWPLAYVGHLGSGDQTAQATVGNDLRAGLVWRDGRLHRGLLRVGIPGVAYPDQAGLQIEARLPQFSPMAWQGLAPAGGGSKGVLSSVPALRQVTLDADRVLLPDLVLGSTHAVVKAGESGWDISLRGLQPKDMTSWPVTDVTTVLRRQQGQWLLSPLTVHQPDATFSGSLTWREVGKTQTLLKGQLDIKDVSDVLAQLGKTSGITSDSGLIKADLRWQGDPQDFALNRLAGTLDGKLKNGRIKEVNGVGFATRLFGLVNASNLLRRLKLDFTDVSRKGLNYDQIAAQGELDRGVINPARLDMEGPTLSLRARGSVNLNTRELDQQLRVAVPVSSAVPVVAGFLAGPVVGGALVAADLLFDKQLARLTSVRYHVSGSWDALRVDDEVIESLPAPAGKVPEKPADAAPENKP